MSENLTVSNLSFLLGELSSHWYEMGIHLKLRKGVLDTIGRDFKNTSYRCMIEMFDSWLLCGEGCTWSTIKKMLREMGKNAEAKRIDHYIPELQRIIGKQGKYNQHCQRLVPMPDRCYEDWWLERFHFVNDRLSHYPDPTLKEWIKDLSLDAMTFLRVVSIYWYRIGIALHIPKSTLDKIEARYNDCDQRLQRMFTAWQRIGYNYSWRKLIETFNELNFGGIAINIEHAARRRIKERSMRIIEMERNVQVHADKHWEKMESKAMKFKSQFNQEREERLKSMYGKFRNIFQCDGADDELAHNLPQLIKKDRHTQDDIMGLVKAVGMAEEKCTAGLEMIKEMKRESIDDLKNLQKKKTDDEKRKKQLKERMDSLLRKKIEIKRIQEADEKNELIKLEDELHDLKERLKEVSISHSYAEFNFERAKSAVNMCIEELETSKKEFKSDDEFLDTLMSKESDFIPVVGGIAGGAAGFIVGAVVLPPLALVGMIGGFFLGAGIAKISAEMTAHEDIVSLIKMNSETNHNKIKEIDEIINELSSIL